MPRSKGIVDGQTEMLSADHDHTKDPHETSTRRKGAYDKVTTNNPVDQHVGRRIRERRKALKLSLSAVAKHLGTSGPQYSKYETGANRISASRLFDISNVLKIPISQLFDAMPKDTVESSPACILTAMPTLTAESDFERRQTDEILRLWGRLPEHARTRIVDIIRTMIDLHEGAGRSAEAGVVRTDAAINCGRPSK